VSIRCTYPVRPLLKRRRNNDAAIATLCKDGAAGLLRVPQGCSTREEREKLEAKHGIAGRKGGVRSLRLLVRQKAQLFGALSSDRSLSVAMQEGVE
jgi:hypothetical protein